jgi:hypothetical protein
MTYHIIRMKENNRITTTDAEKALHKIQHCFMIKMQNVLHTGM